MIDAARQAGIGIFPWVSDFIAELSELDATCTHSLADFEARFGRDYMTRLPQRYWIHWNLVIGMNGFPAQDGQLAGDSTPVISEFGRFSDDTVTGNSK